MRVMNRVKISLIKNKGKTIVLLLLVALLGVFVMGSILAENAFNSTIDHLRRRLPPVVALNGDSERIDELYTREQQSQGYAAYLFEFLTRDQIHSIGSLSHVRYYDYSISLSSSSKLTLYGMEDIELEPHEFSASTFHGVSRSENIYIDEGPYELIYGRVFTVEEMSPESMDAIPPALISIELAELNELSIGDTFNIYIQEFVLPEDANVPEGGFIGLSTEEVWEHPYNNWELNDIEFEVVGIFDFLDKNTVAPTMRQQVLNTLFAPNWIIDEIRMLEFDSTLASLSVFDNPYFDLELAQSWLASSEPFWVLYDILYFDDFQEEASEFLPDFWIFENLASALNEIHESVSIVSNVAQNARWFASGVGLIVLSLLITLYLNDRRQELGIYFALGERKVKIVIQVLMEVFTVAIFGFIIAILIANAVTPQITQNMLQNELLQERSSPTVYWQSRNALEFRGFGGDIPIEETMEVFDVSLDMGMVVVYLIGGFLIIGLSTIVPILYLLELNPKEILMSGKIE